MRPRQVEIWIETGQNVFTTDTPAKAHASDNLPSEDYDETQSSITTSDGSSSHLLIEGAEGDPLIPKPKQIKQVYHNGEETWRQLLELARKLPEGRYPPIIGDISIVMKDVPALPEPLPKTKGLWGWAVWQLSSPSFFVGNDDWSTKSSSAQQCFPLGFDSPLRCLLMEPQSVFPQAAGISLLVLCWSYIFSARLLELQNRKIRYTQSFRTTVSTTTATGSVIDLRNASPRLVRWLSAVLAPSMGWTVKGPLPAWAIYLDADVVLLSDHRISYNPRETPPLAFEAKELLIELCSLFGLASVTCDGKGLIAPSTGAFLATLTIPFYRSSNFSPRLSLLRLGSLGSTAAEVDKDSIQQCFADLRYYMTLSLSNYLGSVIWSIFWQPDISCNLVSPWYASILQVLGPLLKTCNIEIIAKVFLLRRPRVGLWWLGIFLLGDSTILSWVERFLETLEERYGYGSTSKPDLVMAAWSGASQSFLDRSEAGAYPETKDVPRHEILWHRHNLQLGRSTTAWPPSGTTKITDVEPELWPFLEGGSSREYLHWVWLTNGSRDIQHGFRRDTGRFTPDITDRLGLIDSKREQHGEPPEMKVAPSKEATLRMLALAVEDATGDVHPSKACLGGIEGHRWLRHWRGLESQPAFRIYEALNSYVEAQYVRFAIKNGGEVRLRVSEWKEGYNNGRPCWWCMSEDKARYYWCNEIRGKGHQARESDNQIAL
ncbi:hypothetical protein GGR53DRAFT_509024 [Hypoxylon sp. FL1150]|nr:hypothetical protein GGR53DRAFT_509024 [Hypoxylon sp. FL1150]